jgi:uncharacterized protein (TIGR02466 family)
MQKMVLFPTHVHVFDVPNHEEINEEILANFDITHNANGSRSGKNLLDHRNQINAIDVICNTVLENCAAYVNDIFDLQLSTNDFDLKKAWLNVHHPNYPVHFHNHRQTSIAFVYYVSVDELTGGLQFLDPRSGLGWVHPDQMKQFNLHEFNPKNGNMILFPGWLLHSINVNKSDKNRIALAGNVHLKEELYRY